MKIGEYYQNRDVQARMKEFLGGNSLDESPCVYVTTCDDVISSEFEPKPPRELGFYLENGLDISRSLWDRTALIVHLDLEYVNFDYPAEPYFDPLRTFVAQEPVVREMEKVLLGYGIAPLHLLSGRGHHFVWRVDRQAPAFRRLVKMGRLPDHLSARYAHPHRPEGETLDEDLGEAFSGLGLVIEYVAHQVKARAAAESEFPVELTAVAVGPQQRGREMVSIDVSEYGDPLDTRVIRVPFSIYRKPWRKNNVLDSHMIDEIPYMFLIPLHEMDVRQGLLTMRNAQEVAELAGCASVQIPEQSNGMASLIDAYEAADLAGFHTWFYSEGHASPDVWDEIYDPALAEKLPHCIRHILDAPNDLLLKPAGIRQVVVAMRALGWHPRHIAGLICSRFQQDYGWQKEWVIYDAATRADFYVRIFSGLIATGQDELVDFNCLSAKEKQFCFDHDGSCNLEMLREALLEGKGL